jgi:hypothetical protein
MTITERPRFKAPHHHLFPMHTVHYHPHPPPRGTGRRSRSPRRKTRHQSLKHARVLHYGILVASFVQVVCYLHRRHRHITQPICPGEFYHNIPELTYKANPGRRSRSSSISSNELFEELENNIEQGEGKNDSAFDWGAFREARLQQMADDMERTKSLQRQGGTDEWYGSYREIKEERDLIQRSS